MKQDTCDQAGSESTPKQVLFRVRRFMTIKLHWFWLLPISYVCVFVIAPALLTPRPSMVVNAEIRNDTSATVFVVTIDAVGRESFGMTLMPRESQIVALTGGNSTAFWDHPLVVSAFADDGRLLQRWKGTARDFAPNGPTLHEFVIQPSRTNAEGTP